MTFETAQIIFQGFFLPFLRAQDFKNTAGAEVSKRAAPPSTGGVPLNHRLRRRPYKSKDKNVLVDPVLCFTKTTECFTTIESFSRLFSNTV